MAEWDLHRSMEYSQLTNTTGENFSMIPFQEEVISAPDISTDISTVTEGKYNR